LVSQDVRMTPDHNPTSSIPRRRAIVLMAGAGAAVLAACSSDGASSAATSPDTTSPGTTGATDTTSPGTTGSTAGADTTTASTATCSTPIPEETAGPYPGDGSNGPDVLSDSAVVREDITGSFGSYSGTAQGVPITLHLTVLDSGKGCAPLTGGAVYAWHADRDGHYSMYTAAEANYLRGVGEADDTGTVTFQSIFPGCYDGRWPHIHFEVYPSLDDALVASNKIITSQLALPQDMCAVAYTAAGYEASVTNLTHTSLATDMVFRDGVDQQLATVTGDATKGFTVELTMTV
jgi:protocatechuate 3,4-dioxygenase beta subunit